MNCARFVSSCTFQALPKEEGLAEQVNIAISRDLSEECDVSCRELQEFSRDDIVEWQLADFDAFAMLGRGQAAELRLWVLGIDRFMQAEELADESIDPRVVSLE